MLLAPLAQVEAAWQKVRAAGAGRVNILSIGATGSIIRGGLADLLAAHRHRYPSVVTKLVGQAPALQFEALPGPTHASYARRVRTTALGTGLARGCDGCNVGDALTSQTQTMSLAGWSIGWRRAMPGSVVRHSGKQICKSARPL